MTDAQLGPDATAARADDRPTESGSSSRREEKPRQDREPGLAEIMSSGAVQTPTDVMSKEPRPRRG
jgi:hypothetical protein